MKWLASLKASLIIEFVTRDDDMVKTLLRNRGGQYDDYTPESFRSHLEQQFDMHRVKHLKSGARQLYFATHRTAQAGE